MTLALCEVAVPEFCCESSSERAPFSKGPYVMMGIITLEVLRSNISEASQAFKKILA